MKKSTGYLIVILFWLVTIMILSSCGSAGYCMQSEALNPLNKQYSRTCNR